MVFDPGVQFKPIEGNALIANRDFSQMWTHVAVEAVAIHAQVDGRIPKPEQAWGDLHRNLHDPSHFAFCSSDLLTMKRMQLH